MINAKRANALLWTGNLLFIAGIAAFAFQFFVNSKTQSQVMESPGTLPLDHHVERLDPSGLASLQNPLLPPETPLPSQVVLLIGIDRIKNDAAADTAYLYLVGRKLYVNAYVGEPIREAAARREVTELSGWRLKSITSKGAVFSTPQGEKTLTLAPGPASLVTAAWDPSEVRTALDVAVELYKDGRIEDACVVFEEAFRQRPSSDAVYAFMKRAGEEVIASMMNSKDAKMKAIGYRLFELAKPGGERRRISNA